MIVVYVGPHAVRHELKPKRSFTRGVPTWIADGIVGALPSDEFEIYAPARHTTPDKPTVVVWPKDRGLWPAASRFLYAIREHFPTSALSVQSDAEAEDLAAWTGSLPVVASLDSKARRAARTIDLTPSASRFWNTLTLRDYGPEGVWCLAQGWPVTSPLPPIPQAERASESLVIVPSGKSIGSSFTHLRASLESEAANLGVEVVAFAESDADRAAQLRTAGAVIALGDSPYAFWAAHYGTPTVVILPLPKMLVTKLLLDRYANVMYTSSDPAKTPASAAVPLMAHAYDLLINGVGPREPLVPPVNTVAASPEEWKARWGDRYTDDGEGDDFGDEETDED